MEAHDRILLDGPVRTIGRRTTRSTLGSGRTLIDATPGRASVILPIEARSRRRASHPEEFVDRFPWAGPLSFRPDMPRVGRVDPADERADTLWRMTPEDVARLVQLRDEDVFVGLLRASDPEFENAGFERRVADALRTEPSLIGQWAAWSGDQRWTPSAGVDGVTTYWVPAGGGTSERVRIHPDSAAAVADFIHRLAAGSLAGRYLSSQNDA